MPVSMRRSLKFSRLLIKPAGGVLGCTSPCDVPGGYASVAARPAALPDGLSEQPATTKTNDGSCPDIKE